MKMTMQMSEDLTTLNRVEMIIDMLKCLTSKGDWVDGETMEYILEKVEMSDQMLRQLVMKYPESDTIAILNEKIEILGK